MDYKTKKELNSGMCSTAYVLDNKYIQLIGKREDAYNSYKDIKNNSLLLEGKISCVKIPNNMELIEPNKDFPYGSLIYPMVKGKSLNPKSLTKTQQIKFAKKLLEFNQELHSSNIHWDREWAINHEMQKVNKNIEILKEYLEAEKIQKLKKYSEIFKNYLLSKKNFCITHGDLWADNLIVNSKNELIGIIDFGNMAYFLPEVDYASMWNMMDGFLDILIKNSNEDITKESVYLFVVHRELCFFEYIINTEPKDEIDCQLEKIKQALFLFETQLKL